MNVTAAQRENRDLDTRRASAYPGRRGTRLGRFVMSGIYCGRLPAAIVALGLAATVYGFLYSGDFAVQEVVVRGARLGEPGDVVTRAGALEPSIFRVDPDAVAEQVARLPWVERAYVTAELPGTVTIEVVERAPAAVWQVNGSSYLVDASGNVLLANDDTTLPHVTVDTPDAIAGGNIPASDVAAVIAVQETLGNRLAHLDWSTARGLTATLTNDRLVIFGDSSRMALKLAVWEATTPLDREWEVLDLREPERPYLR